MLKHSMKASRLITEEAPTSIVNRKRPQIRMCHHVRCIDFSDPLLKPAQFGLTKVYPIQALCQQA